MPQGQVESAKKTFVKPVRGLDARIAQDEKELEELMAAELRKRNGEPDPEPEQEVDEDEGKETDEGKEPKEEKEPESKEEQSFKKRYGDLRRHMQQKEKEWEERLKELEAKAEKPAKGIAPPRSDEDVEEWVSKHPEVAGIVTALAAKEAETRYSKMEERFKKLDEEQSEITRQRAEAKIKKAHEDFDTITASDEFHDWAESQPKWIQNALYDNADDADSVIRVMDLYKIDAGMTVKDRKKAEREAASSVKTNGRTQVQEDESASYFKESQVAKMSDTEYEKNEPKIMEAMKSGKFIYDISGGAR